MKCAIHGTPGRGVAAAGVHPPVDDLSAEALGFILSVPEPAGIRATLVGLALDRLTHAGVISVSVPDLRFSQDSSYKTMA
jgi:hypothetical protein